MVSSHRGVGEADPAASRGASAAALLPEERRSMPDVNMPKLSDTMEEGTIVEWKKKSGDEVKTGEVLAEVESDKATFDLEADADGVLQILVDQGVPAKIGAPIARIGEAGAEPAPQPKAKPKEPETPTPVAEERAPAQKSPTARGAKGKAGPSQATNPGWTARRPGDQGLTPGATAGRG